jgi:hypothetical protein
MGRSLVIISLLLTSLMYVAPSHAIQNSCDSAEYAVNYSQRQVQFAQNRLFQQQNALLSLQNRLDSRLLSLQLQVDQAAAWKQSAGGATAGNAVGCAIRTIFWGGGRCFANAVSQAIRLQARANAQYNLAVNRLNTFQNSAAMQLSRFQQRIAQYQLQYDSAVSKFQLSENAYLQCVASQQQQTTSAA